MGRCVVWRVAETDSASDECVPSRDVWLLSTIVDSSMATDMQTTSMWLAQDLTHEVYVTSSAYVLMVGINASFQPTLLGATQFPQLQVS